MYYNVYIYIYIYIYVQREDLLERREAGGRGYMDTILLKYNGYI